YQGEGERGAHVAVVAVLLPRPSRPDDIIPCRVARNDKTLLNGDKVAPVLHELETETRQMSPRGIARVIVREVVTQNLRAPASRRVRKRECAFEHLRGRSRIGRQGKTCAIIDRCGGRSV